MSSDIKSVRRPFSFLPIFGDFDKRLNRFFDDDSLSGKMGFHWQPKIDVLDEEKQIIVKVDIPGIDPKMIDIQFDNNTLTIKGELDTEQEDKKKNFIYYERNRGIFYRQISLPNIIDGEHISAKANNGVLVISLPKLKQSVTKKIVIHHE